MIAFPGGENSGGLGGNLRAEGTRDTRLLERAVKEAWPIPDEYRKPVVERMYAIVTNKRTKAREASVAARVLVAMEGQNQAAVQKALDRLAPTQAASVTNQQVNIYLPANGREIDALTNGHNGNGKH